MKHGRRAWVLVLALGALACITILLSGDRGHDVNTLGEAAIAAFAEGKFELYEPYTPAGLDGDARLRLMCGDDEIDAKCRARHARAMEAAVAERDRFAAAFDDAVNLAKTAGFDWRGASLVSVDTSGVQTTPPRIGSEVESSGRLLVHGQSPKGGPFVLELTGCAKITWRGWLCAIPRWRPGPKTEGPKP